MIALEQMYEEHTEDFASSVLKDMVSAGASAETTSPEEQDELLRQLQDTLEKLKQIEAEKEEILQSIEKTKKKYKYTLQFGLVVCILAAVIRFHREMGQVGWNCLQAVTYFFGGSPELLTGLALFLGGMYLLYLLFKWTVSAAVEDLLEVEALSHDLDHR